MTDFPEHVVIVGGGLAGARLAKLIHRDAYARVTMVSVAKDYLHTPAAVRLCTDPALIGEYTFDIPAAYAAAARTVASSSGPVPAFTFVRGRCTETDFEQKKIKFAIDGSTEDGELSFDKLVIATGVQQASPLWGFDYSEDATYAAMRQTAADLAKASSVAVVGAGATGVEVAAEIAEHFPALVRKIKLYAGQHPPLLNRFGRQRANYLQKRLQRMGIEVLQVHADATTLSDSVVLPAYGYRPTTSFVKDTHYLDTEGWIKTDAHLRVCPGVYAVGDVVSGSPKSWPDAYDQAALLYDTLKYDWCRSKQHPSKYKFDSYADTFMVTLGTNDGVGIIKGYSCPAFIVRWYKGADFGAKKLTYVKP